MSTRSLSGRPTLPRKVSNQVLLHLSNAWQSFFKATVALREDPTRFLGRPRLPGYKSKADGRNLLVYERGTISKRALKKGLIQPSGLNITIPTDYKAVDQVRIVPRKGHYVVEVVYTIRPQPAD